MLESFTIVSKGGIILYQYTANPSLMGANDPVEHTRLALNMLIAKMVLDPSFDQKNHHIHQGITFSWIHDTEKIVVAIYPDILFEGPRHYLRSWAEHLVQQAGQEYEMFYEAAMQNQKKNNIKNINPDDPVAGFRAVLPDPEPFDKTFKILLQQSKSQKYVPSADPANKPSAAEKEKVGSSTNKKDPSGGKTKRIWYDGTAKVTEKAMAELDKSADPIGDGANSPEALERALNEARQAYLPAADEMLDPDDQPGSEMVPAVGDSSDGTSAEEWGSSLTNLLQQLSAKKILQASDLDKPLQQMEELLTSKNVAREIAHELCESCRRKLTGKRLNSLYRVQTAVRQALEAVLSKMLQSDVDLLRNVLSKRGDVSVFLTAGRKRAPYVITVMGINGIGKTTSLAKLAFYFRQNGCSPLLVAGDTFRSGAVEQLKVHAQCLDVPLFSQGYSKDPSAVAKAAIQHATEEGNDVVLIDTAGRMQNNVPLMKALGKLVQENKPDFVILVCEALVGHDGLDQFQMFGQALGNRVIDGLILTKFDTVSDKVGAALTLTHKTGAPIVFCGTGQKYHHLRKLSVPAVIQSLLS